LRGTASRDVIGAYEGDDVVLGLEAMTSPAAGREMTISPAGLATISYMVKVTTITYLVWSASTGSKVARVSTSYLAAVVDDCNGDGGPAPSPSDTAINCEAISNIP